MNRTFLSLSVAIIGLLLPVPVIVAQNHQSEQLRNFHMVNEQLYRGGQPKISDFERLKQFGIKSVVNLRKEDDRARADGQLAQQAGLRFFNVPLARHARPTDEQIERVLSIITAPENQPVFVYCRRGADRTGVVIAAYRVLENGWTSKMATAEANRHGMFPTQLEMKDYIRRSYCKQQPADLGCGDESLIDEIGLAAAGGTRRLVEKVGAHELTRNSVSKVKRLF